MTFLDPSCVQKVIDSRPHYLDNKEVYEKSSIAVVDSVVNIRY